MKLSETSTYGHPSFRPGEKMKSLWGQKPPQQLLLYGALALVLYLGRADLIAVWSLIYIILVFRNWKKSKQSSACELWITRLKEELWEGY